MVRLQASQPGQVITYYMGDLATDRRTNRTLRRIALLALCAAQPQHKIVRLGYGRGRNEFHVGLGLGHLIQYRQDFKKYVYELVRNGQPIDLDALEDALTSIRFAEKDPHEPKPEMRDKWRNRRNR